MPPAATGKGPAGDFDPYVRKLKNSLPGGEDVRMSAGAVAALNNLIGHLHEQLTASIRKGCEYSGLKTVTTDEVHTRVGMIIPGGLAKRCCAHSMDAITAAVECPPDEAERTRLNTRADVIFPASVTGIKGVMRLKTARYVGLVVGAVLETVAREMLECIMQRMQERGESTMRVSHVSALIHADGRASRGGEFADLWGDWHFISDG